MKQLYLKIYNVCHLVPIADNSYRGRTNVAQRMPQWSRNYVSF